MSDGSDSRTGLDVVVMSADTEQQLMVKLRELKFETLKTADVIAIYPRGSKVFAWVRVESRFVELSSGPPVEGTKKVTKTRKKITSKK